METIRIKIETQILYAIFLFKLKHLLINLRQKISKLYSIKPMGKMIITKTTDGSQTSHRRLQTNHRQLQRSHRLQTRQRRLQTSHIWWQTSRSQLQTSDRQLQTGSLLLCNLCEFSRFTSYCQYPNKHFPLQSQQEKHKKTRKKCEICSKLTIKTPYVIDMVLVSSLLTLNIFRTLFWCFHC